MVNDPSLPFSVNRNDARSLVDQVADGLRQAIVAGRWTVGEEIPSSRELVPLLGVSRIVTKAALARLVAEGYVLTRHGLPPTVRDQGAKQWKGHVVFVYSSLNTGYYQMVFAEELRTRLNRAGFLFTRATIATDPSTGADDFSLVDVALANSVDLVVVLANNQTVFRHLAKRGIPFAAVSHWQSKPDGAIGLTRFDGETALDGLAMSCLTAGICKANIMHWEARPYASEAAARLRADGMAVSTVIAKPDFSLGKLTAIERAGYLEFMRRIKSGRLGRDAIWFFADDYLARGALLAMSLEGVNAPEDIRVATLANTGNCPIYRRELSRVEVDPIASGATVAEAAIAFLNTGLYPEHSTIGPKWIHGETLSANDTISIENKT